MKKKKGFTLMELLASIVIMGVIALILVPVVSGIIEKTRKSAFSRSADSILRISNEYYSNNNTSFLNTGARNFSCNNIECKTTIIDEDGNDKDEILKTEGAMGNGYVKIYEKGEVEFLLSNGTYCAAKNPLKEDIKVYNGTCDNIIMDNQKIKIENVETTSTTRSITVKVTVSAGVSGISGYQFYIDGTWGKFIESLDSTYEYTFDELREKKHEIKVRVYNGTYGRQEFDEEIGMDESKLISVELSDFGDITITSSSKNWETSKTYILDGTTTGATLQYKVVSGTTVKQDWTNYSSAITVNWTSTTTNPTYIYARFNDGYNTSGETTHIETKIDTTAPVLTLGSATTTTKSIMIPITVNKDDESGIKSTTCVYGTSTSYGSTGTVSNNKCIISNLKNNTTYYYKVTTTNNAGLQTTKTGSNKTGETAITFNPITQVPTNTTYAQSKTVTINYTATNVTNPTYYVKTTVATTSTMNGYSCGIETNPGTCSTTATKNYAANTWYKVTGNLSITFKENGEIIARINDGESYSSAETLVITKIDATAPVLTLGSATTTTKSIMIPITVNKDDESGIKSTTCVYGTSTSYGSTGTVSNNKCIISNLKNNTTYYYKVTTTNNAGLQTTKTGSNKTGETAITFNPITQVPTNTTYAQSKTVTINYTATNVTNPTYYVKTTVATTSTMNGYSCGIETNPGTCSTTATKNYAANTWYKVTGNLSITFKENGEIIARINDGESYSSAETLVITKIDTTAPTVTLTKGTVTTNSITVVANAKDAESGIKNYQFSIDDGSTWTALQTSNTYKFTGLKSGTTYKLKAKTNNNANLSATSSTLSVTTSTLACPTFEESPTGWATKKTVTIKYPSESIANTYSIDNGTTWTTYTTALTFTANGTVTAKASDGTNTCQTSRSIVVDTSTPSLTISAVKSTSGTAVSSGSWSNETLKYTITSTGTNPSGVTIKYCVDTNNTCTPSTTIASGTTFSLNNTGTYYVRYQGTTGAGKTNSVASYKAMVDTVRPTVSMSPSGGTYSSYKTVTVTANDTNYLSMAVHVYKNSALVYSGKVDGKSTNSTSSSYFDVALDSEGTWTIYTTAYDKALNTQNQNPNNGSWYYQEYTIDSIGPLDITMSSDTAWTKSKNITLTLQDGGGTGLAAGKIKYGWSTSNTTAPTSYTEVSYAATTGTNTTTVTASGSGLNGQYYLWVVPVTYKDNAGNSNTTTIKSSAAYKFDSTAPTLSVSVPNGTTVATSKTATITIKDTGGSGLTAGTYNIYYGWGSSASNACSNMTTYKTITTTAGSSSASTTVTLNAGTGNYNIYVCNKDVAIKDVAGNTLSANTRQSVSAYLDNTRPTVSMSPSGGTYSSYKTVTVTASDTNFDHMDVQVYKGKTLQSSISKNSITSTTYDVSLNSDAVWTIYVKAYDKAGNTQSQTPQNDSGYYYQEYTINTTKLLVLNGLNIDNGWVGDANNINLQANCPSGVTNYVFDIYDLNYPDRIATTKTVGSTATSITYLFTSNLSEMTYPFPATDHYGQPITINQKFKGSLKINLSCKNASGTTIASTSRTVQIDTTPVLSLYSANATTTSFDAVISIKNLGSGINHVYYAKGHGTTESLDNGTSTTRTFTGFTSCSYHYITAHVINNVGLTGSISTYLWTGGCDSSSGSTYCGGTAGGIVNTATNVNCGTINGCPAYATVYTCKDGTNTGYVGCSPKCS